LATITSSTTVEMAIIHSPLTSSQAEMDGALEILAAHKDIWAQMSISARIALLDQLKKDLPRIEKRWVAAGMAARDTHPETTAEGEEWYSITVVYRQIRFLRKALQDIARFGKPRFPRKVSTRPNGQVVAQVVPFDWKERFALSGIRAEIWMDPSVSLHNGGIPQAKFYNRAGNTGRVSLILGAGNVSGLVPADFLYKLFVEGQVVALKMNPVNAYLGPIFADGFSALIQAGFLQICYGGAQEGTYLANHPLVDTLHMTGSDRTFDAIVFGPGDEGRRRKQARQPILTKPFTAELGNVSPVIIIPGPWTEKDLHNQSARMGSWFAPNSSCNCNTPRMLIQMKNWQQREKLNRGIADYLAGTDTRKAYYPGSFELHQQFIDAHPQALQLGDPHPGHLPWTFIPDVDPTRMDDICFNREPFMSLFSETALQADSVVDFIRKAVDFANERLWGTLIASIVVHPESLKDPEIASAIDQAIADLRYGSIVINQWGAFAHYMTITPWGGYPGSDIFDVQSGIGFVNNPLMFDRPQKSVIYTDFTPLVDPFRANMSNSYLYYRQDTRFQMDPSVINLAKLVWRAVTAKETPLHRQVRKE
jgi:acyl-CoA reductase-like NAD-dependent aldehyde dehydrogenase